MIPTRTSSAPLCFRLCCCCNDDVSLLGSWTECWPDHVPRSCQISLHFPLRPSFPPHIFMFLFLIYFIFLTSSTVSQPRSAPIYSLIFSPTRRSPFINLGKLWSPNYFSFIMNDRFWTRYNLPIENKMNLKKWMLILVVHLDVVIRPFFVFSAWPFYRSCHLEWRQILCFVFAPCASTKDK